jgi:hypothetical protein
MWSFMSLIKRRLVDQARSKPSLAMLGEVDLPWVRQISKNF